MMFGRTSSVRLLHRSSPMSKQLVFTLGTLLAALSPLAPAQTFPGISPPATTVDCSDPTMASSPDCSTGQQNINPPTQNQGQFGNFPSTAGSQAPGQQQQTIIDNGGLGNQNQNRNATNRIPLPPEPLTEFQKFVASTTGQILPIFGESLFRYVPSTFAPLDQVPVPPDYILGPGDELRIRAWGQVNFNADVRIDRQGEIYLPQVGTVHVAGLPYQALDEHIRSAVGRIFRNFDLIADVGQIRAIQVYVVGQAHRPGTYTISSLSTLVDAVFASGGPSVQGSMRHILLKRNGETVVDFDLYDLLVNGDKSKDAKLQSGDVIFIPPVGPVVAFAGSVRRPAIYELRGETTIDQLLKSAGGASAIASGARISIERIQDRENRLAMEVDFDAAGLATPLHDGDVLRILSITPSYQKTVTLRGNTANPGRFAWHEGMRLSDLIPDKDSLLTRNYWWRRTQLGLSAPEFQPIPALGTPNQPTNPVDLQRQRNYPPYLRNFPDCNTYNPNNPNAYGCSQSDNINSIYSNNNPSGPDYYANQGGNYYNDYPYPYTPQPDQELFTGTEPINPPPTAQPGYGGPYQQQQQPGVRPNPNQQVSSTSLAGREEVRTQNTAGVTQRTVVTLPAPEIDWDYAVIERLDPNTLKTSLLTFDLGKLVLQHDPSQNLEVQAGDIVTVFSQADIHVPIAQQTKFVRLEGEFAHAGTYSVKPGETLPQLVERAGGFTDDAYLYGSEFTRESTRVAQQRRIDEYINNLQLEISRGSLAQSASATNTAQDVAASAAAAASSRELVARLQQVRATGRVVLELKPDSAGIASLPDLQLEDGDRFVVPSVPANVNVVGAVYDQNSFVYRTGRRVGEYLHLAGGPNRDADKKYIFIIRADGSVISRTASSGVWGNTFDSLRMNPGDTIVVPEKTFRPSGLRNFLEWSQLFSQLAFGAAAIAVIQ